MGKSGPFSGEVGVVYYIEKNKVNINLFSMPLDGYAGGNDEAQVMLTNFNTIGSYSPAGSSSGVRVASMQLFGASQGTEVPGMKAGYFVTMMSGTQHETITIYKDGEPHTTLSSGDLEWYDTYEPLKSNGAYSFTWVIPENGDYRFEADGSLHCVVTEVKPLPSFSGISVDSNANTVEWFLDEAATEKIDNGGELFVRLTLRDTLTGNWRRSISVNFKSNT